MTTHRVEGTPDARPCDGKAWLVTKFPDDTVIEAHPQHGEEDQARAAALGYPDVGSMTLDHDVMHQVVSWAVRGQGSRVPTGTEDAELAQAEEEAVLAIQRYANAIREHRHTQS